MVNIEKMTLAQLDAYALEKGIDLGASKTRAEKAAAIAEAEAVRAEPIEFDVMGVKGEVDAAAFDDFEVFELLGEIQSGNVFVYPKLCRILFGSDWPRVHQELKGESDRLSATRAVAFFVGVMEAAGAKN